MQLRLSFGTRAAADRWELQAVAASTFGDVGKVDLGR